MLHAQLNSAILEGMKKPPPPTVTPKTNKSSKRLETRTSAACPDVTTSDERRIQGDTAETIEFSKLVAERSNGASQENSAQRQSENMDAVFEEVGKRIRQARIATRRITRPKLAERMNILTARLRDIEEGSVRPSDREIWLAALHIGCPLHELIPVHNSASPAETAHSQTDHVAMFSRAQTEGLRSPHPTSPTSESNLADSAAPAARLADELRATLQRHTKRAKNLLSDHDRKD